MRSWATLAGFCMANFSNGLGFGLYTNNLNLYAAYYQTSMAVMENTFYIGLVVEILLCLFVIRLVEWRFDYAVMASAYLTACSYWLQHFSQGNVVLVVAALILNSIAQLALLPSPLYLAEVWFEQEKRSLVIGLGFYSNILGFGLGGTLSSLLSVPGTLLSISAIILGISVMASASFVATLVLVKNQPKVKIQIIKRVEWKHAKDLWRQKFTAYNIIMASVFLGAAWTFLSLFEQLQTPYPNMTAVLNLIWVVSGGGSGIIMSWLVQKWIDKTGDYKYYDRTCKIILLVGILGNLLLGTLVQFKYRSLPAYIVSVILIGIGTIGFFGLAFLSLIESLYPVPVLLIGTIISLFASIYSIISLSVSQLFPLVNGYYSIAVMTFLPWVYYVVTFHTNFKRYKYYLNEKDSKFELLKIEEVSQKGQE